MRPTVLIRAVEIEINSYCNRACSYCPNSKLTRLETGDMKPEVFYKILDQLKLNDFKGRLSFHFYGEPLLSKNLDMFIAYARQRLPSSSLHIYSNGTLLSPSRFKSLIALGVSELFITKQEEDIDNNDYLFDKTYKGLTDDQKKMVTFINHDKLLKSNRAGLLNINNEKLPIKRPCLIPMASIYFTLEGNVLPCYEDYLQKEVMGNIMRSDLGEIWHSPKYSLFREEIKKGERGFSELCKNCNSKIMLSL